MPRFASYDGTEIAYRVLGDGPALVCLPGGPGRAGEYLGDLGGLAGERQLVLLDPRGVGASADPVDAGTFRADRLADDIEALRGHLGLERMDLLGHSAGAVLATLYAAAHPRRLSRLLLITPGLGTVDINVTSEEFDALVGRHSARPWYPAARAALESITAGSWSLEDFRASRPLFYGTWDSAAEEHATMGVAERHQPAREGFFAGLEIDPAAVKAALRALTAPVLLYAGDADPLVTPAMVTAAAPLFNDATVTVQPGAGHFPWIDDPAAFAAAIESFLR